MAGELHRVGVETLTRDELEAAYRALVAQCAHEARWVAVQDVFDQAALAVLAPDVTPGAELAKARAARILAGDWSVIET